MPWSQGVTGARNWKGAPSTASLTLIQWRCLFTPLTITAVVANFTLRKIRIIPGKIPIHPLGSRILPVPQLSERVRGEEVPERGGSPRSWSRVQSRSKTTDARRVKNREGTQLRGERDQRTVKPLPGRGPASPSPARPGAGPAPLPSLEVQELLTCSGPHPTTGKPRLPQSEAPLQRQPGSIDTNGSNQAVALGNGGTAIPTPPL